jgi:hypothetical protein
MKLAWRDAVATMLVVAVVVAYVGLLVRGEMPFLQDTRGLAGTGLVLGFLAFPVLRWRGKRSDDRNDTVFALVSLVVGVAALALDETAAADALLAT